MDINQILPRCFCIQGNEREIRECGFSAMVEHGLITVFTLIKIVSAGPPSGSQNHGVCSDSCQVASLVS